MMRPTVMCSVRRRLAARDHFRNVGGIAFSIGEATNLDFTKFGACGTIQIRKEKIPRIPADE